MSIQETCAERIEANKKSRLEDIREALKKEDPEEEGGVDELNEMVLSCDVEKHIKIHLSTGGPGDWFELVYDKDDELLRGEYHFQDWFDHADVELTKEEAGLVESVYLFGDPSVILNKD